MERADATAFLVTAAAVLATNAAAAVATAGCFMLPEIFWKNPPQCRGSWPGFESEPSSLERLTPDHLLTGKPRTSAIRLADGESSRDQFDPTDRAGGTTGLEPVMPGIAGVVGLPSRAGALGNRTGSRAGRSLPCSPLHPETNNRVAITAARPNVLFISQLLRE